MPIASDELGVAGDFLRRFGGGHVAGASSERRGAAVSGGEAVERERPREAQLACLVSRGRARKRERL